MSTGLSNKNTTNFISNLIGYYKDFTQSNKFFVEFITPFNLPYTQEISLFVKSINIPQKQFSQLTLTYSGYKFYLPNKIQFEPIKVTFVNDIDQKVNNFLNKWIDILSDFENDKLLIPEMYKDCKIKVTQYSRDGQREVKQYLFHNVLFTGIDDQSLDYENEQVLELSGTFYYSHRTEEI